MTKTHPQHCAWRCTGTLGSNPKYFGFFRRNWHGYLHIMMKSSGFCICFLVFVLREMSSLSLSFRGDPHSQPSHSLCLSLLLSVEMISRSAGPDRVQPSVLMFLRTVFSHCESCGCGILDIFIKGATTNISDWQQTNYTPTCYRSMPSFEYYVWFVICWCESR